MAKEAKEDVKTAKKRKFKKLHDVHLKPCCIEELLDNQDRIDQLEDLRTFMATATLLTILEPKIEHVFTMIAIGDWEKLAEGVDTLGIIVASMICRKCHAHLYLHHGDNTLEQFWRNVAEAFYPGGEGGSCGM